MVACVLNQAKGMNVCVVSRLVGETVSKIILVYRLMKNHLDLASASPSPPLRALLPQPPHA